ncbi:MAG: DUF4395 domain-containing protein [Ilumatobacteraceae bacterium]
MIKRWLVFPDRVDEVSARLVAAGVVAQAVAFLAVRQWWVLIPLVYGFLARVLHGPRFSPLALLVTKVVTPRIGGEHRLLPGPPKRFAQGIGLAFSGGALIAWLLGAHLVSIVLIAGLVVAATLESALALCLGCIAFNRLMRWGVIPASACIECGDISVRLAAATRPSVQPSVHSGVH